MFYVVKDKEGKIETSSLHCDLWLTPSVLLHEHLSPSDSPIWYLWGCQGTFGHRWRNIEKSVKRPWLQWQLSHTTSSVFPCKWNIVCYETLRQQLKAAKRFLNTKFFISPMFVTSGSVATTKIQRSPPPRGVGFPKTGTVAFVGFSECLAVCSCLINT